jgi:hypothetical protein
MDYLWVVLILFAAAFTQSLSGFGSALVAMPLLVIVIPEATEAAAVMSMAALVQLVSLVIYYRRHLDVGAVWRLCLPGFVAIPLGIAALHLVPPSAIFLVLGVVTGGYALYALFGLRLPPMRGNAWAYVMGAFAGLLGGAINANGPPVVIYGQCRGWPPRPFKSNLQTFFLVNNTVILVGRFIAGDVTRQAALYFASALPAIALALTLGLWLSRYVRPALFRRIVLFLLLVLSARMFWRAWTAAGA